MVKRTPIEPVALDDISVDRTAEVPLGVQLAWALRSRIGDGRLLANQRLPGLRDLAEEIGVNLNTVRSVYQRLEHEGLLETRQGSGTYVAGGATPATPAGEIAAEAAREALERGVSPREVAAALYVAAPAAPAVDREAPRRAAIRAEIASLERVLVTLEAAHPGVKRPEPPRRPRSRGPQLLGVAELEAVRSGLTQTLAALQAAIDGKDAQGRDDARKGARRAPAKPSAARSAKTAKAQSAGKARRSGPVRPAPSGA